MAVNEGNVQFDEKFSSLVVDGAGADVGSKAFQRTWGLGIPCNLAAGSGRILEQITG